MTWRVSRGQHLSRIGLVSAYLAFTVMWALLLEQVKLCLLSKEVIRCQ